MKFVHISDLHFNPENDGRTSKEIREQLIPYLRDLNLSADDLLITGDLRHAGKQGKEQSDIDKVVEYIKEIAAAIHITSEDHIHLVPGNHDRDRFKNEDEEKRIAEIRKNYSVAKGLFEEKDLDFLLQQFEYFKKVCSTLYGPDNYWTNAELHTYRVLDGTVFLYLNTAIMHNEDNDRDDLIIGNDCLDRLLREIKIKHPDFPIIVLAHHSPDCFRKSEKEAFEHILMAHPKASLYLCGDAHEAWPRKVNHHLEITMGCLKQDAGVETTFLVGDTESQELTAHHWVKAWEPFTAMNQKLQELLPSKKNEKKLSFNNIPYAENVHFTGRKEILDEIKNSLKPGEKNPCSLALYGTGGVGKTQIALAYALNNADLYDAIWWVNAENELAMISSYKEFLQRKGIIKEEATYKGEEIVQFVRGWMEQNDNWLFIYDNAENEQELTNFLPLVNTGHILITSRNQYWHNRKRIAVDVFQPQEVADFFNRFELEGSPEDAEELAKELGHLPLALAQAAAYMLENNKSYQEYLTLFQRYRLEVFEKAEYESPYGQTVATTWHISLEKIGDESAKQLIGLLAFLAPDHIQKEIFIKAAEHLPEPLASAVTNELDFNNTIKSLARYSLIQCEQGQMRIHRLLQEVIRQLLEDKQAYYLSCCVSFLNKLFIYNQFDMKSWENCASLMPHVQSALLHEEKLKTETVTIADLYINGAEWFRHIAQFEKSLEWHEKALILYKKAFGSNHPNVATIYNNIGSIYDLQWKYDKALEWYKKALLIQEKVFGFNHSYTATIYNNIGVVYGKQSKHKEALEWLEKALVIDETVLGKNHLSTAMTYNNIAAIYNELGEYKKSLEWYEKALVIVENILGLNHSYTATMYNNIAGVYDNQGEDDVALEWYGKALRVSVKNLGPDHQDTATIYNNIALVYNDHKKYIEAKEWLEKALKIIEKVLGSDHPFTATTYHNMARIYDGQGEDDKALE